MCEICMHSLPKKIQIDDRYFSLVDVELPIEPYIMLEQIGKNYSLGVTIISSKNALTKIGRGHTANFKI